MSSDTNANNKYSLSQAALYIGVPVLVGASCYYLYASNRSKGDGEKGDSSSSSSASTKDLKEKKKQLTPLEQVMQIKQTGNQNYSRKNYDIAIEHYTNAIELSKTIQPSVKPDDLAIFYQNRAACHEAQGKYEQVIEDCNQAIELKKTYIKAYLRRAKAYEKLENYEKALVDAFAANLLEKFQNQSSMLLTENIVKASSKVKAAEAMKTHRPTWPANQTIKAYFSAFTHDPIKEQLKTDSIKSYEQLQPLLDEANKPENENDPMSLLVRGSCLSLMGEMKQAQEDFEKLLGFSDTDCSPRLKSNALIKKSAIVISDPSSVGTSIEKDLELVYELLDKAIELDPENPDIYLHKAQALTLSEKLDKAVETLETALELKEDFYAAMAQKFYIEFKLGTRDSMSTGSMQKLLRKFRKAVEENPDAHDLHQMYAQVLTEMSDFEQADQVLLNLIKMDPTDGSVHISRALLQFHLKSDPDEVAVLLKEALKMDPKIIFAYEILGSLENQRGKIDEAIEIFETATKYASTESEYARCYSLLDSARCQKAATELLGLQVVLIIKEHLNVLTTTTSSMLMTIGK